MDQRDAQTWVVVLAGGGGTRLRSLTTLADGVTVPKQFWSLTGGPSLLEETIDRARTLAPDKRICAVVAAEHRRWWESQLAQLPNDNIMVQPKNLGTGIGILFPLMHVLECDPDACVVLLPSDHYVEHERVLEASVREAIGVTRMHPDEIIMLGVMPESPDPELGYLVPGRCDLPHVYTIDRFVEKPSREAAERLIADGALWSAFIVVARARALVAMFERKFPRAVDELGCFVRRLHRCGEDCDTAQSYERLPEIDFSNDVLRGNETNARVFAVPHCGWTDLGTLRRVADALQRLAREERTTLRSGPRRAARSATHSLAAQYSRIRVA